MPEIALTKCQGTGNDFVLLDDRADAGLPYAALARTLCDRRFGVGADGLLVLRRAARSADLAMRIFNADGSEAEMCGNGLRCISRYIARERREERPLDIETAAGIVRTEPAGADAVRVRMGTPVLADPLETVIDIEGRALRFARVSMGNPHAVIFVDEPLEALALDALATALASLDTRSGGINVELATLHLGRIHMRVHERGVGETQACGTGACAAAAVAITTGRARSPVSVVSRGGDVSVAWAGRGEPAFLTGTAQLIFDTHIDVDENGRIAARENGRPLAVEPTRPV
jgi:diaminopimelate epimerase